MRIMDVNLIWLAVIVLVSYTAQAMSGFGSTIIAVTLGIHLYPLDVLLPVLVPLDMLVNTYIAARHHRQINRPHLFRTILPLMAIGLLAGILVFNFVEGRFLKILFGVLVVLLSVRETYRLLRHASDQIEISGLSAKACIFSAGVVHGIYASGGPLLIYAVSRLNLKKAAFRSTLSAVWSIFSVILTGSYLIGGKFTSQSLKFIIILLPLILVGIPLGEWLHRRIDEYRFKLLVFIVLILAGISICFG